MNWVDAVLLVLLATMAVIGFKKGLIRELSATLTIVVAGITSVVYLDTVAVWIFEQTGGSPLVAAFLAFGLLLGGAYALFKLLGLVFYRIADLKSTGKQDNLGGAIIGVVRGWVVVGCLLFVMFLLPLPERVYTAFEGSLLGPTFAKTVPMLYETTSRIHRANPSFMAKVEHTLLTAPGGNGSGRGAVSDERAEVYRVIYQIDRFFNTKSNRS